VKFALICPSGMQVYVISRRASQNVLCSVTRSSRSNEQMLGKNDLDFSIKCYEQLRHYHQVSLPSATWIKSIASFFFSYININHKSLLINIKNPHRRSLEDVYKICILGLTKSPLFHTCFDLSNILSIPDVTVSSIRDQKLFKKYIIWWLP